MAKIGHNLAQQLVEVDFYCYQLYVPQCFMLIFLNFVDWNGFCYIYDGLLVFLVIFYGFRCIYIGVFILFLVRQSNVSREPNIP